MNLFSQHYRAWLVPYVEGRLDVRRRARLEARLARDPALAAEAEAQRRVCQRLREASQARAVEAEAASASVWPDIEARIRPRPVPARTRAWVAGGLCAAATLAWAAVWGPSADQGGARPAPAAQAQGDSTRSITAAPIAPGQGRSGRKRRRWNERMAVRPAAPLSLAREHRDRRTKPAADLQAAGGVPPMGATPPTDILPQSVSGAHFQLAAHDPHDSGRTPGNGSDAASSRSDVAQGAGTVMTSKPAAEDKPADGLSAPERAEKHRRTRHGHPVYGSDTAPSPGSPAPPEADSPASPSAGSSRPPSLRHTPVD